MMKSDSGTSILINNIKSNISEIKIAQEKLDTNPENEEYKWVLKHSKENLKSRINRLIKRIDSVILSENEGITIIDGEDNKKSINELIKSLSDLGLPEIQSQINEIKDHLNGEIIDRKPESKPELKSESENISIKEDFIENDLDNINDVEFKSSYDFDPQKNNSTNFYNNDTPYDNNMGFVNNDTPYDNNMGFVNNDTPYDNNMGFVNNDSPYANNMNSYETYTPDQLENGEVVEANDSTLKDKPEGIKNKAIEAFKRLISKLKQLTTKKEKIENEIEKRPSIDKKQLAKKTQQSQRKPIIQRFKELISRLVKTKKTKVSVEAELNRRNLNEFIEKSKDVAQETIQSAKEKIKEGTDKFVSRARIAKDKIIGGASVIKDNANKAKNSISNRAKKVGKVAFRGFKTAGMVSVGTVVLGAEAIAKATKDVKNASKNKIQDILSSGNSTANRLLDKMEEAVIKKEAKTSEKINELQHYNPKKTADAEQK